MRLFVSAKQANIGFVRVKSHADVLPHCSPSNLGPRFQLCHGLKLFICWRHVKEKGRQKRQVCKNTSIQQVYLAISIRLVSQWTSKRKKITDGVCWTRCICARPFSNKRSSSPAAEDSQIWLLPHFPALSDLPFFHHSLTICSKSWMCPDSFLCMSVVQQLGFQANQHTYFTEPVSSERQL